MDTIVIPDKRISMLKIMVNRKDVLEILKGNREKHKQVVIDAQKGYRERVIKELEQRLTDAQNGRPINTYINLVVPENHTKDYDRVIKMFEMSIDEEIEISEQEFGPYVQDDWAWRRQFATSSLSYTQSASQYLDEEEEED